MPQVAAASADSTLMFTIALVLLVSAAVVLISGRLGQPPVVGEILAGIMLGPSVLGLFPGEPDQRLFPPEVVSQLHALSQVGLVLFMFLAGWELRPGLLRGRLRSLALTASGSVIVPFCLGAVLAQALYGGHAVVDGRPVDRLAFVLYLGTALSITAFPVLARMLAEKGLQGGKLGTMALSCAAVGDVVAWCLLAVVMIRVESAGNGRLLLILGGTAVFVGCGYFVVRPLLAVLVRRGAEPGAAVPLFVVVSAGALLFASATSLIGVHAIFGAFAFGLIMPAPSSRTHRSVAVPFGHISRLLLPIFFVVSGLAADVTSLGASGVLVVGAVFVLACAGKFIGAAVPARITGMSWRDSTGLGVLMNTRGLTELVVLQIGRQSGLIDDGLYTALVLMAVVTTAMAVPLLRLLGFVRSDASRPFLPDGATGFGADAEPGSVPGRTGT
ncbi:cation:proton antiporter domain-containing protein [Saccharopolyspora sp. NPDC002578]